MAQNLLDLPSGHGFDRAERLSLSERLQPLSVAEAPQGLKPTRFPILIGTTKVVP